MEFRLILKSKPKGFIPIECQSKSSPMCKGTFIISRQEQTMCLPCLAYNDLLGSHPLI